MSSCLPFFSVIVPTYARPLQLDACLHSLAGLEYPRGRLEVIVVDDGSETPASAVVERYQDRLPLTLLTQPNQGPAIARNTGAAASGGDYLAFTDDDCAPASDWLRALAGQFSTTPDHAVGGRTIGALADNPYSTASQLLVDYLIEYSLARVTPFFTSNNLALPAARFHSIGGFDPTYVRAAAEDREFCDRWLASGFPMVYAPEARVYHAHVLSFRTFLQQHYHYGYGAFRFHRTRHLRRQARLKVEPPSFYLELLRYPYRRYGRQSATRLAILLAAAQAANAAGFGRAWMGEKSWRATDTRFSTSEGQPP
jgi:glycosyltransferase involved in cell wall biosynthesis